MFEREKSALSKAEQVDFFEILSNFVSTGLGVNDAIQSYQDGEEKGSFSYNLCTMLLRDLDNGLPLSEAMTKHPKSFPPFVTGVLSVAEQTGQLGKALQEILFRQKLDLTISSKVKQATLVPKISVGFGIFAFFFAAVFVIPKMGEVLLSLNTDLPLLTQIVMMVGGAISDYWYLFALGFIGLFFYYRHLKDHSPERLAKILLKLPFWKPIVMNQVRYDFCTLMGICIDAGIPPEQAMDHTAEATDNYFLRNLIRRAKHHIDNEGTYFDEALKKEDIIPLFDKKLYRMLHSGRVAGRTGDIMRKQSVYYREKLMAATDQVGDKIGMVVITPIYVMVTVLIAAVVLPIIKLGANAGFTQF
ncbi:type II secretion system F family protein [Mitsuokella multacida]